MIKPEKLISKKVLVGKLSKALKPLLSLPYTGALVILILSIFVQTLNPLTVQAASVSTGGINAVAPARILDTRTKTGGHLNPLAAGETLNLQVLGGSGIPLAGVSAVIVNVTVVNATRQGYVTLYPKGVARPTASTINFPQTLAVANTAMIRVGTDKSISLFNFNGSADVIIDVEGWVGSGTSEAQTVATTPKRVLDSRTTNGGRNGKPLAAGEIMRLPILGTNGIPASGISSVIVNIGAIPSATTGHITAYPTATSRPLASTLSITTAKLPVSNFATLPVGADGAINVYSSSKDIHLVVDVQGWMTTGNPSTAMGSKAQAGSRILDTRTTLGGHQRPLSPTTFDLPVLGVGGVPATGVSAVIVHITAIGPTRQSYFKVFGSGMVEPTSSIVNFNVGSTVSSTAILPVGWNGAISIKNMYGYANAIVDVQGWIATSTTNVKAPIPSTLTGTGLNLPTGSETALQDTERSKQILTNANKYAMTPWWNDVAPALLAYPINSNEQHNSQDVVRRLSMQAFSIGTSLATNAYDETAIGVPADIATTRTIQMIDRVASMHVTNHADGWGACWQSPMWSNYVGRAAWLLWPKLNPELQAKVTRMVNFEANFAAGEATHYLRNASGTIITAGNSGSDDSWTAQVVQLALVMFPGHPHTAVWQYSLVHTSLASWARPSDITNTTVIHGAPVSKWINGSNIEQNGAIINHSRVAPDYSTLIYQNMDAVLVNSLAGQPTQKATIALLAPVYAAFRSVNYTGTAPNLAPGGPVYMNNSATIYYPQANDWGSGQMLPFALVDAQTAAYGIGGSSAPIYEALHANAQLAMQARFTDGRTYANNTEYRYVGREEHIAQQAAQLFLTKVVRDRNLVTFEDSSYWLQ